MVSQLAAPTLATLGVLTMSLAAGCFYDWDDRQPPTTTTTTTTTLSSGGGASDGGATTTGAGGAPVAVCPSCGDGFYCDYPDGLCGTGAEGSCQPPPPAGGERVCGCDGNAYASMNAAALAGVDVQHADKCTAECGDSVCNTVTQACSTQPPALPQCKDLSLTSCTQAADICACLEAADPACKCSIEPTGLILLGC